jgi:hypothetical protein
MKTTTRPLPVVVTTETTAKSTTETTTPPLPVVVTTETTTKSTTETTTLNTEKTTFSFWQGITNKRHAIDIYLHV